MKRFGKTIISLFMCTTLGLSSVIASLAAPGEPSGSLNPFVVMDEKVEKGSELNLTEEGTLDWVHITGNEVNRKNSVEELITWENLDPGSMLTTATDSAMGYTWTDGNNVAEKTNYTYTGIFNCNEITTGIVEKDAGYRITVPEANEARTLTFVSGIWQASAEIQISVKDAEKPVYTGQLRAGGSADMHKYTVMIRPGNQVTVTAKIKEKTNPSGNITLGGIALKGHKISLLDVKVQDASEVPNLNLTEKGDLDWVHYEGEQGAGGSGTGTTVKKAGVTSQMTTQNLSQDSTTTMSDAMTKYAWSDGDPTQEAADIRTGAVYTYKNGDDSSVGTEIGEPAGYELKVQAANQDRELVVVSGVWNAEASFSIKLDGEEPPVYENNDLSAGDASVCKVYTVAVQAGKSLTITGQIKKKNHAYGNFNLQAAALSSTLTLNDYKSLLQEKVTEVENLDLSECEVYCVEQLEAELMHSKEVLAAENTTNEEYYTTLLFLTQAYVSCLNSEIQGSFMYESNSGLTSSFGWEGDKDAPIAFIDGSYKLRDNGNQMVTFGVKDIPGKIKWYNAEGYLPCFVSEYAKDGMEYKIENFANKCTINGQDFEIAYSRMTVKNTTAQEKYLPKVSSNLIPLNDAAKEQKKIEAGAISVREYAIGADRFAGNYDYPENELIVQQGSFDKNYAEMKEYWNKRLEPLTQLELPDEQLTNAYKAGFIYTLIIRDDIYGEKRLHVGENGYDQLFDHDTIGIVASLLTEGDFMNAKDYLATLPAQLQYDDAKWKYSWPYALYLSKTGDCEFILEKFDTIKNNTHYVESDRIDGGKGIIKKTNAIDSNGHWLIDNWSALAGLSTYRYLCDELFKTYNTSIYQTESEWAQSQYQSLLEVVEKTQKEMRETNNYPYLSIDMNVTTENSARGDARDANWASMFLFGRWAWDGYLFGADQEGSEMITLIDDTYTHGFERRKDISDSIYNFGGYPHGYYSSAYNAGYGSTALRGEEYRDSGIKAYQFMIENSMSGLFGWWEGVDYQDDRSPWDIKHARGGGGSCQHMWGQSTASKVLIDSLIAEKIGDKIIIGRGVPEEWIAEGKSFAVSNHTVEKGKKIGYKVETSSDGKKVTVEFTGDQTELPLSIEFIKFKDNIKTVSEGAEYQQKEGLVKVSGGTKKVVVTLKGAPDDNEDSALKEAEGDLKRIMEEAKEKQASVYTEHSYQIMQDLLKEAENLLSTEGRTREQVRDLENKLQKAVKDLKEKADMSILNALIADCEKIDWNQYTEESVEQFNKVLNKAKEMLQNNNISKEDARLVDNMVKELSEAKANLEFKETHTHNIIKVDAVEATCTEGGNIEYWYCQDCLKYFGDKEGKEELTYDVIMTKEKGHEWESEYRIDKAPTETEKGYKSIHCKNCDATKDSVTIPASSKADTNESKTQNSGLNTLKTGDQLPIMGLVVVLIISFGGIILALIKMYKRQR